MLFPNHFQLRDGDIHQDGNEDPDQNDRQRQQAECVRDDGPLGARHGVLRARVGHADFTRQNVWALTPSDLFSLWITPSTVMRQPI